MAEDNDERHGHDGYAGLHSHEGGALHWHDEFGLHLAEDLSEEEIAAQKFEWHMENVQVVTVGVDIGSSTSHLMFSRINMQKFGEDAETHFVVVGREVLWQSPIILTPYRNDNTIDADVLRKFVLRAYGEVGATANEVDSGVIILTGEALKRNNARAIAEVFAKHTGKFVSAAAGHHLEAVLAANGSGTLARSRRDQSTLLNVDIGGGTTKLALVRDGEILATAAVAIGARLLVKDDEGRLTRIHEPARRVAKQLDIRLALGEPLSDEDEARIVQTWTDILAGLIERQTPQGLAAELMLTEPLPSDALPKAVIFSGGVSEFIFQREYRDFGDLGMPLAKAIRGALGRTITLPTIIEPNLGIRATAIGASQFTVQAGTNLYVSDESILPLRNVPVLAPKIELEGELDAARVAAAIRESAVRLDLEEGEEPIAIALRWPGELEPARVLALAQGIRDALPRTIELKVPFVLLADQTIAHYLGTVLKEELGVPGDFISLEGVAVAEFDFVDVGEVIHPTEVAPVTIKSLLFAGGLDRRSVKQALLTAAKSRARLRPMSGARANLRDD
ncbi:MAG: reactivating factor for ethanolamine ammonia lyase [Dehalococcoidia bacterium]|nr:reactivating factor for ethanolamine ammonia lyase [Dehalococcoidia bacterium]